MQNSVAKRYAKALFDVAHDQTATKPSQVEDTLSSLKDLEQALSESHDLRTILVNPAVTPQKRHAIVREIGKKAGWETFFCNFVCLLVDRARVTLVPSITAAFQAEVDQQKGLVRVHIMSARPLNQQALEKIVGAVKKRTKSPVAVESSIDPGLIGGVVARVGETVYDASLKTQLEKVRRAILESV